MRNVTSDPRFALSVFIGVASVSIGILAANVRRDKLSGSGRGKTR